MRDDPKFAELREDIEAKQKATVWPDTMRNGSSVDAFLWKGDPKQSQSNAQAWLFSASHS